MSAPDTVTLTRVEYEALLDRLEDAEDENAIKRFEARVAAEGWEAATRNCLPAELVWRMLDGEHPLAIWRQRRKLSGAKLAVLAGVPQSYISEIETRKKPGSLGAMAKLARALGVTIDDLTPES
jgi:DNA-binding XRE family transcriptional regulator